MTAQRLHARLNPLSDSLKQVQQLINRLAKLPAKPSVGLSSLDDGDARAELSSEIHQGLKELEEELELLRQETEDQTNSSSWPSAGRRRDTDTEKVKTDLVAKVTHLGEDLKITRAQFRKAQLQAQRNVEAAKRKERELLFAGIEEGKFNKDYGRRRGQEKLSEEEQLLNASSDVTASLRRTHNLMSAELERSQFARETLENSTKDLTSLSESYTNLDTLLSSSRSLVSTLIHSQKSDTWYLESAFFVLCATIGWLVFRRIIYGPGWWLAYFPLKIIWRFSLFTVQVLAGSISAFAGALGSKNRSSAASHVSESVSTTLAQIPTGTGEIPTRPPNMAAPSIHAGAGGYGAKAGPADRFNRPQEKLISDHVGEMAEEKKVEGQQSVDVQNQETVLRDRRADEPPNPKKRMWEEPVADPHPGGNPRDEL